MRTVHMPTSLDTNMVFHTHTCTNIKINPLLVRTPGSVMTSKTQQLNCGVLLCKRECTKPALRMHSACYWNVVWHCLVMLCGWWFLIFSIDAKHSSTCTQYTHNAHTMHTQCTQKTQFTTVCIHACKCACVQRLHATNRGRGDRGLGMYTSPSSSPRHA